MRMYSRLILQDEIFVPFFRVRWAPLWLLMKSLGMSIEGPATNYRFVICCKTISTFARFTFVWFIRNPKNSGEIGYNPNQVGFIDSMLKMKTRRMKETT